MAHMYIYDWNDVRSESRGILPTESFHIPQPCMDSCSTMEHHQGGGQSTKVCVPHKTTESLGQLGIGSAKPYICTVKGDAGQRCTCM